MYKFMLFDIDGTLVKGDMSTNLGPKTKEMLEEMHKKGIYLGLASGRYLDDLSNYKKKWGMSFPFDCLVGCNGAMLRDELQDKDYYYFRLTLQEMREIMEGMEKYNCLCHIYYPDFTLYSFDDPLVEEARRRHWSDNIIVAKNVEEMLVREAEKIMYFTGEDPEYNKEVEAYAKKLCEGKNFYVTRTRNTMIEFGVRGSNKTYGMKKFCEYHNIDVKDTIAFGDTSNDNDMVEAAGLGVCLINGTDDTKAVADVITEKDCEHDGVGYFIEDYLIKNNLV